jgi:hypothetical protein
MFVVKNVDSAKNLAGFTITLASNDDALEFVSGQVRTATSPDEEINGVTVSLSDDDRTIYLTNLQVATSGTVAIWLDLNQGYAATTTFTVTAQY